ncbi:MAG: YkgJ family cysteine cluster protein [Cystobacter sp.]
MSSSDLCRRCGLCCDGNLFSHVPLERAEVDAARRQGLVVLELPGQGPALRQGCAALHDRQCSVYDARPLGCRRYGCQLLAALEQKALPLEDALAVVEQAHSLLAEVERELEPDPDPAASVLERARFASWGGDAETTARTTAARERAEAFLDQHFHGGPRRFEVL